MQDNGLILFIAIIGTISAPLVVFSWFFPNAELSLFHILWWIVAVWVELYVLKTVVEVTTSWVHKYSKRTRDLRG